VGRRRKPTPDEHGFDYWFATVDNANPSHKDPVNFIRNGTPVGRIEGYSCQLVVDEAISWLENHRDPNAPFFLNVWFHEPHAPIAAPNEIVSQYGDLKDPAAIYSGTIENTDRAIARLLAKIKEIDSLENTLIVYASDNGSYRKERNGSLRSDKGSNFEGGIRVPGIFYWPGRIKAGHVEHELAGLVDLLPTVCGLVGIDRPRGVHLDGCDLTPLLTGRRDEFERHQPLFFMLPTSNPAATVRDGKFALVAYRDYELPIDYAAMRKLMAQAETILRNEDSPVLRDGDLWSKMFNSKFANGEAERLRIQFVRLMQFHESWIPAIKSGGYGRIELYDLDADLGQKKDVSKDHPDVTERLKKQLLEIHASVMDDGPNWDATGEAPADRRSTASTSNTTKRPNVVMLLADDLGWKDIGCYGGPVKTPTLDRLAVGGVRFTDFYSGAAVCSPSRATLLTGRQHLRAGIYSWIHDSEQNSHLLEREVTLAEVLKDNGYETAHLGKWHLGMPTPQKPNKPTPADHGFDYWFATANNAQPSHQDPVNFIRNGKPVGKTEGYACQVVVDEAISWLDEQRDPNKPFFLNVWFHEPHAPIAAPDGIVSGYGKLNEPAAIYSGTIDNTDQATARLLEKLEQVDSPENTLIIYSSDNGSYRADRVGHLRGTKGSNYDGGIRVPGIFYWPGTIAEGRVEHEPAGLVDLLPTVCGLLGIDKPQNVHLDGSDLAPLLISGKDEFVRHQPLFWLLPASGPAVGIRDGRYSLVAHRDYEFPKDRERMAALRTQIEQVLKRNGTLEDEIRGSTLDKQMFEGFKDREAEQLRSQFILLNMFSESWIPAIKGGTYGRFELFDMAQDSGQTQDVSKQHPDIVTKLKKQLLEINASIMADAPDWSVETNRRR
jgi:arylsulfatase A